MNKFFQLLAVSIIVSQVVAMIFQCVDIFVFDLPATPPGSNDYLNLVVGDVMIGDDNNGFKE